METGILGLLGSTVLAFGVLLMLGRSLARGHDEDTNNIRFTFLIGPASYVVYGLLSNSTLTIGYVNTWTVLVVSMLALTPAFESRRRSIMPFVRQLTPTKSDRSIRSERSGKPEFQIN